MAKRMQNSILGHQHLHLRMLFENLSADNRRARYPPHTRVTVTSRAQLGHFMQN
jgi:hypothetical protein